MVIIIKGEVFGARPEQRAEVLMQRDDAIIVESCGDPTRIAKIYPKDILGVEITPGITLRTKAIVTGRQ